MVTAVLVSSAATAVAISVLRRVQLLDLPNSRSSHVAPIPRGGGLGPMVGIGAACWVAWKSMSGGDERVLLTVLLGGLVLASLGFADDIRGLSARSRLLVQIATATAATGLLLGLIDPDIGLPVRVVVLLVGIVWVIGFVNAFNFMDGVNGISALSAAVAGGWFVVVGQGVNEPVIIALGLAIAGAGVGFLPWNSPKAQVFLGDVGSYGFGGLLGLSAFSVILFGGGWLAAVAPLAVYLADTSTTLMIRVYRGQSLSDAHRDHVYQRLVDGGWTHLGAACLVAGWALLICFAVYWLDPVAAVLLSALLLVAYLMAPFWANRIILKGPAA